jgi:hypothetical protein
VRLQLQEFIVPVARTMMAKSIRQHNEMAWKIGWLRLGPGQGLGDRVNGMCMTM